MRPRSILRACGAGAQGSCDQLPEYGYSPRGRPAAVTRPAAHAASLPSAGGRETGCRANLAHGLLDHAQHLLRLGDAQAAETAITQARDIAARLRCQPLLGRAAAITSAEPRALA